MRLWADEEFHFLLIAHCRGNLGHGENEAPAVVFGERKGTKAAIEGSAATQARDVSKE